MTHFAHHYQLTNRNLLNSPQSCHAQSVFCCCPSHCHASGHSRRMKRTKGRPGHLTRSTCTIIQRPASVALASEPANTTLTRPLNVTSTTCVCRTLSSHCPPPRSPVRTELASIKPHESVRRKIKCIVRSLIDTTKMFMVRESSLVINQNRI
jgi:hypothetical protein